MLTEVLADQRVFVEEAYSEQGKLAKLVVLDFLRAYEEDRRRRGEHAAIVARCNEDG